MKIDIDLPDWLTAEDIYQPRKNRIPFIEKNISGLIQLISGLRHSYAEGSLLNRIQPTFKLPAVILTILLISLSGNPIFLWGISVCLLLLLSFMPLSILKQVLAAGLTAALFAFLTMLPAWIFGFGGHIFLMTVRVWLAVSFAGLMAMSTRWMDFAGALKIFYVPDLFILILGMTLKHITILAELTIELFYALRLRSVGRTKRQSVSVSGIAGVLFLKSKDMTEELQHAMTCRGFTGEYNKKKIKTDFRLSDVACMSYMLLLAIAFFYFK